MSNGKNKKREIIIRTYIGYSFIFLLGLTILGKGLYIQIKEGKQLIALAEKLTISPGTVEAERGNIYSKDGKLLATSTPIFDLRIDFKAEGLTKEMFNKNVDSLSLLLSEKFGDKTAAQYKAELIRQYKNKNRYYLLKRNVSFTDLQEIKKWPLFKLPSHKSGLIAQAKDKRQFPYLGLAQRTIGFVSGDSSRKVGLEGYFNEILHGRDGRRMMQKIANNVYLPLENGELIKAIPGKDIYTTLDVDLQDVAQSSLKNALAKHKADHGCVILMEVATGKIRAIANLGMTKDSGYAELQNYAVGEAMEPGSTFKLATAAALVEDGIVNENTIIDLEGGAKTFYKLTIKDHEAPESPSLSLKRCFEVSSNVAFAKLAFNNYSSAPKKFYQHLERFGFSKKLDIEVSGPAEPMLASYKNWSGVSTAFMAHGYELRITPLHTLSFYNAIANNGIYVYPTLLEKIAEYDRLLDSNKTKINETRVVSEKTAAQLKHMMEGVVLNGTAKNLLTDYLSIAGKTGTAKIAQNNRGYKEAIYQASFCGYFPADAPRYSMIVVVNAPSNGVYYGNVVAGSVFREVADKVYSLSLDMQHPYKYKDSGKSVPLIAAGHADEVRKAYQLLSQWVGGNAQEWAKISSNGKVLNMQEVDMNRNLVPDVRGMAVKDAFFLLESKGLQVHVKGKGTIRSQSLVGGTKFKKGDQITIILG